MGSPSEYACGRGRGRRGSEATLEHAARITPLGKMLNLLLNTRSRSVTALVNKIQDTAPGGY